MIADRSDQWHNDRIIGLVSQWFTSMKLFISYSSDDQEWVHALAHALNPHHTVWLDRRVVPSSDWWEAILAELKASECLLYILTPRSVESVYCRAEIEYALTLRKPIIPLMLIPCEYPDTLKTRRIQYHPIADPDAISNLLWVIERALHQVTVDRYTTNKYQLPDPLPSPPHFSTISPLDPIKEAIARAWDFKGMKNRDWTPFITTFPDFPIPDMPFCLVPVGSFMMGSDDGENKDPSNLSKPLHQQKITKPFWIAKYPVTNAQWRLGVELNALPRPKSNVSDRWYDNPQMANAPVTGIVWNDANKFAQWLGCRLPTEREWEYAARGVESLIYPWGNTFDHDLAVYRGNNGGAPHIVTSRAQGASWVGACHLSGNVLEWCNTRYFEKAFPYPYVENDGRETAITHQSWQRLYDRITRGGSWKDSEQFLPTWVRWWSGVNARSKETGFRCFRPIDDSSNRDQST
ncbi:MAG: SUMF1/EgtB/PvdO family nonheme iron enzyme [Anaerolineae bacterium]|nr:SUMF1/EgtB/PvdO family nonheme iron enzyme [Anaerolineae bacterium]